MHRIDDLYDHRVRVIDLVTGRDFKDDDPPDLFDIGGLAARIGSDPCVAPGGRRAARTSAPAKKPAAAKPEPDPHRSLSLPHVGDTPTRIFRCDSYDMIVTVNGGCRC